MLICNCKALGFSAGEQIFNELKDKNNRQVYTWTFFQGCYGYLNATWFSSFLTFESNSLCLFFSRNISRFCHYLHCIQDTYRRARAWPSGCKAFGRVRARAKVYCIKQSTLFYFLLRLCILYYQNFRDQFLNLLLIM